MSIEKIPDQVDRPIACTYFATNLFMQKVSFSVSPSPLVMYSSTASSHLHLLPFQNKDSVRFVDEGFRNVSQNFALLDFCRSENVSQYFFRRTTTTRLLPLTHSLITDLPTAS